jgi:Lon protease-like protein
MSGPTPLLPLFPLPNVVHFPGTLLPLHIFEPRYRTMVRDLLDLPEPERLVGMLLSGGPPEPGEGVQTLILPGTAGRLVGVESLADGRFDILLHGEFRFEIAEEVGGKPYRRALVRPLPEGGPAAESLRDGLLRDLAEVAAETGPRFPLPAEEVAELLAHAALPELVNRLAAELDLPVGRRQAMLALGLPERAEAIASTLASRRRLLAALRPFRHLADRAGAN